LKSRGASIPRGFRLGGFPTGLKGNKNDIGIVLCDRPALFFAEVTAQRFRGPCIRELERIRGRLDFFFISSGNANAATGARGVEDHRSLVEATARRLGNLEKRQMRGAGLSTGVIGRYLPIQKMISRINLLPRSLLGREQSHLLRFSRAIMTTDLFSKLSGMKLAKGRLTGISKGAGMVHPQLGTTQTILLTDTAFPRSARRIFREACDSTFGRISVDGELSTNDAWVILSSGFYPAASPPAFSRALKKVLGELSLLVVSDGEGTGRLIRLKITGLGAGRARVLADHLLRSPLIKTAAHGNLPNWGRIYARVGGGPFKVSERRLNIFLNGQKYFSCGQILFPRWRKQKKFYDIHVKIGSRKESMEFLGSDLSKKYVEINAAYN